MRSTLDEFTKELQELRALVASIAPVNAALSDHENSLVRQYVLVRRRFDYAAFAVALYASLEKFIEGLVAAYAQLESRRLRYVELPPKLARKHLTRTADILSRGRLGEGRYVGLSELDLVKNLFECLNGERLYSLNEAAVVAHDLNLRVGEIDAMFATVGIEQISERVRHADPLVDWYREVKGDAALPADGVPASIIEERIKDLVERRNQVAHRGGTPVDLLGASEMCEAVGFIHAFAQSTFVMTVERYLRQHHAGAGTELVQRADDGPYRNGKIVIVDAPSAHLFRGQPLFVLGESIGARWGRIQGLQLDGVAVDTVEPGLASNGIGVELDFKCPKDARLVALAAEDDLVWSPLGAVDSAE